MKESSKERLATLLMEELLEQLPMRERLRKMFGDMTSQPIDEVIEHLLIEFERTVAEYRLKQFVAKKQETDKRPSKPSDNNSVESFPAPSEKTNGSVAPALKPVVAPTSPMKSEPDSSAPEPVKSVQAITEPTALEPAKTEPSRMEPSKTEPSKTEPLKAVPLEQRKSQPAPPEPIHIESRQPEADKPTSVQHPPQRKVESNGQPVKPIQLNPIKLELPKIQLKLPDVPGVIIEQQESVAAPPTSTVQPEARKAPSPAPMTKAHEEQLRKLEEMAKKLEAEYEARRARQQAEAALEVSEPEPFDVLSGNPVLRVDDQAAGNVLTQEDDEEIDNGEEIGSGKQTSRARHHFADDEYAYVHGVSKIPEGESPVPEPFMLEEKGIDGHEFAFALDYKGLRYYLSKFSPTEMNVSKAMVLLLNKQESLQCQGAHQNVLNDLRGHGILLPFDFGTVVRGRDSLLSVIDKNDEDIEEALVDVEKTTWWTVTASVLDATIAKIVGTDVQTVGRDRSRERASYTSTAQGKKFDIKVLERILQREKKIAEAVHSSLSAVAKRADLDTMVGLGSGSSEDWKVILKASYDVPKRDIAKFNRTITDLQYHHLQYDLMLALAGKKDSLTLRRK